MARKLLASKRATATAACALLTVVLAGCTPAPSRSVSVIGKTLTIYASAPSTAAGGAAAQDVLNAEQLALEQAGGQVGSFKVVLKPLAVSAEPTTARGTAQITANARKAVLDSSTIAYLGELAPHTSFGSIGITSAQDLLQVSPTDTAVELTQKTPAVAGAPDSYYQSVKTYGLTFGRVVPTSAVEAQAQVQAMKALHVQRLYVTNDGSSYGAAMAYAVTQDARSTMTVLDGAASAAKLASSGADALFYGVSSPAGGAQLFDAVAAVRPKVKLFGPSALDGDAFASALAPSARPNVYISSPGFLPQDLPSAGRQFAAQFQSRYHHAPSLEAIFGYTAMGAVLTAMHDAGASANSRAQVLKHFFTLKNVPSAIGTYTMDPAGDIGFASSAPLVVAHFQAGKLVPFKFVPVPG